MRVLVFFDLPTLTIQNRREYTQFRKHLQKSGFMMLQESVYVKLALNQTVANTICSSLRKHKPSNGLVLMLTVTEKQFQNMEFIVGEMSNNTVATDERLVII